MQNVYWMVASKMWLGLSSYYIGSTKFLNGCSCDPISTGKYLNLQSTSFQSSYLRRVTRAGGDWGRTTLTFFIKKVEKSALILWNNALIVTMYVLKQRFESRWMSVKLICYIYFYFFIKFTTSFVGDILWWTELVIIRYSNLCNTTIFET